MILQLLNPNPPTSDDATGYMAPYVRVAVHVGYCIQWIATTTDDDWSAVVAPNEAASRTRVAQDLREVLRHLSQNEDNINEFVSEATATAIRSIENNMIELTNALESEEPPTRLDTMAELSTFAHNLAYAAALYEQSTSGNRGASEGRLS